MAHGQDGSLVGSAIASCFGETGVTTMKLRYATFLWPAMLAACANSQSLSINVADTWKQNIANFDMTPIYPPQEDVRPGDVFLLGTDEPGTKPPSWVTRVGSLDKAVIMAALTNNYRGRLTIEPMNIPSTTDPATAPATDPTPVTPPKSGSAPAGKRLPAPVFEVGAADNDTVNGNTHDPKFRMQVLALPDLSVARVATGSVSGGGPVSGFGSIFGGLSASSQASVDLALENLEELRLPASDTVHLVRKYQAKFLAEHLKPTDLISLVAKRGRADVVALCETDFKKLDDDGISLLVANGVVYTHTISYSFTDGSSFAGTIAADVTALAAVSPKAPPTAGPAAPPAANPAPAGLSAQVPAQIAALQALSSTFGANTPGAQVSFGIGKTGNLTLKKSYRQPLAIGFVAREQFTIGELMATVRDDISGIAPAAMAALDEDGTIKPARDILAADKDRVGASCQFYGANGSALAAYLTPPVPATTGGPGLPAIMPKTPTRGVVPFKAALRPVN
jgi:hypothetical protein